MTPTATYRLQFRNGMDFDHAAGIAPYLARLGVSHLYASPIFQAMPGSSHGYDVTDHGRLDESLGGEECFVRLSDALKTHGLSLILDIVPNHMAASPHNPWWRNVLRHGRNSHYAGHFDIDWSAPKLLLTTLGKPYGEALEDGEFALGVAEDGLVWRYYENAFPLDTGTWGIALDEAGVAPDTVHRNSGRIEALSRDLDLMHRLHEAQPWRLTHWRAARDMLTHRRFFEITDLAGVRVEDEAVFDDVHRLLFRLIEEDRVQGIRVDHVDGLADPTGYLERLKRKAPGNPPIWVEKILVGDEELPDWPIEGTTGYEFARAATAVLTDGAGVERLDPLYRAARGQPADYAAMLDEAKRRILTRNLAAELALLVDMVRNSLAEDPKARDWGPDSLRRAILATAVAMEVYRSYPDNGARLEAALAAARRDPALDDPGVLDPLGQALRDNARLRTRFEQTTGALMAKAAEDTAFYRYHRLISANEVGAEPDHPSLDASEFHNDMTRRLETQPGGLSATATHDTKRGEDARMRIAAIAEAPERWAEAVGRFEAVLGPDAGLDAETRWMFYQGLLGAWEPEDPALADRVSGWMLKAAREAKLRTSWVRQDADYEASLDDFTRRTLGDPDFREVFGRSATPFVEVGARKSLAQLALKLTAPGVPDIYQGTEWADFSLVDPDNRRPVDFEARSAALDAPAQGFDGLKMSLTRFGLDLRRSHPALFAEGDYHPVEVTAPEPWRPLAYLRRHAEYVLAVVIERSGPRGEHAVHLPLEDGLSKVAEWPEGTVALQDAGADVGRALAQTGVSMALLERG